jgi:hypothetical protein
MQAPAVSDIKPAGLRHPWLARSGKNSGSRVCSSEQARLKLLVQEMLEDDDGIARHCVLAACGRGFDLVEKVDDVQLPEPASPGPLVDPPADPRW